MILHLLDRSDLRSFSSTGTHRPASLATEGFVHCTGDDELMLRVADRFYRDLADPCVVSVDETRLSSPTRWEPPAPLPTDWNGEPLFPHVYGPLEFDAVVMIRRLVRDSDGRYCGYEVDAESRPTA